MFVCCPLILFWCTVTVPPNGLVVYCGTIMTEEGKEKKVNIDFEPFKPINTSLYLCDNKFHTEVRERHTKGRKREKKATLITESERERQKDRY